MELTSTMWMGEYYATEILHGYYFSHYSFEKGLPMTLVAVKRINDAVYVAADSRITFDDHHYKDDSIKIVPCTNRYLLATSGLASFLFDKRRFNQVVDEHMEYMQDRLPHEIDEYIGGRFQAYLEETYQEIIHTPGEESNIEVWNEKTHMELWSVGVDENPKTWQPELSIVMQEITRGGIEKHTFCGQTWRFSGFKRATQYASMFTVAHPLNTMTEQNVVNYINQIFRGAIAACEEIGKPTVGGPIHIYKLGFDGIIQLQ